MNELIRALGGFVLALFICHAAGANAGHEWKVSVGKDVAIAVDGRQLRIDRSLTSMLRRAEAAAFLPLEFGGSPVKSWRWLIVREPSRARGRASFCGAGYEDRLLLVEVTKSAGKVVGQFLVQSCLNSISMDIDQFDELLAAINIEEQDRRLTLEQSISNEAGSFRQNVQIDVNSGQMKVFIHKVAD